MGHSISLEINSNSYSIPEDAKSIYNVREDDELSISIEYDGQICQADVYIEDTRPETVFFAKKNGGVVSVPKCRYFSECFGQAYIRIYVDTSSYIIFFNVMAKKVSVASAVSMIKYLANHHESIIKSCFSRSSFPVGARAGVVADPESIISAAEKFISSFLLHRSEFIASRRSRLIPSRQPLWKSNRNNCDIDPTDILGNLDAISPTDQQGDLFLRGRYFSLGEIDVSSLIETDNVLENKILIGGLYSIKAKINMLLNSLDQRTTDSLVLDGYESFERLLLTITSTGMVKRCIYLCEQTDKLIRFFESVLGVRYAGELRPVMTPYARTSKVYRALYTHLAHWYSLGDPSFGASNFLMKLKSLSKIYEIYSLFHLLEHMLSNGWVGIEVTSDPELGEFIPREVRMKLGEIVATVSYEPKISPLNSFQARHLDLVDVAHRKPLADFNYWQPDFVIRLDSVNGKTKYIILDAKYTTEYTAKFARLPDVVDKYFWGMSVFDEERGEYSNEHIAAVLVVYPLGIRSKYIPYGRRLGLGDKYLPLPVIGAVGLSIDAENSFDRIVRNVLNAVNRSVTC